MSKKCSNPNCTCSPCKCGANCQCGKCSNPNCTCSPCKCGPNCKCASASSSSCCGCSCGSLFSFRTLFKLIIVAALCVGFHLFVDRKENYVFDPKVIQEFAKRGIAIAQKKNNNNASATAIIKEVTREAKLAYPQYINTEADGREWMFNNAGGAMGNMLVMHCSMSEYLIIFGTPLGTEGHTGRFFADDYFTIISGEQWAAPPGEHEKEVYKPGMQHYLPRHTAKHYKMPDSGCFAIELAQGNIVSMLPFGLFDTVFSTLDFYTWFQTAEISAKDMITYAMKGKI